jgi:glycosyltransferase involved in cell wall biosynthesis
MTQCLTQNGNVMSNPEPALRPGSERTSSAPRRITHVITGLQRGGAEVMLYRLLAAMDPSNFRAHVISLRGGGPMEADIRALGVAVDTIGMRGTLPTPREMSRLVRSLKSSAPDIVQTWMYHADLLGGIAARVALRVPVIWGLHNSTLEPSSTKLTTRVTARLNALASYWVPSAIISCSNASAAVHKRLGYASGKIVVIPNGFDLSAFRPIPDARQSICRELSLPPDVWLVGHFARFHPQKDHQNLCRAAALIAAQRGDIHFLLAGDGITSQNPTLNAWIAATGIADRFHLLGARTDMPRLTAALDLALMTSSFGEAFPLVLGEAMACEVPCVATDVGDAAELIGPTGMVVRPRDAEALAGAVLTMCSLPRDERVRRGRLARQRIARKLSIQVVADRYRALYESFDQPGP